MGTYTVAFTIPLAIFMGIYTRYIRPGRIGEVSIIGLVFLVFAIISGVGSLKAKLGHLILTILVFNSLGC